MIFQIDTIDNVSTILGLNTDQWLVIIGIVVTILISLTIFLNKLYISWKKKKETCAELYENGGWISIKRLSYGNLDGSRIKRDELNPPNHEKLFEEITNLFKSPENKNILIKAPSLSGKTHFTIRFLKQLNKTYVLQVKFKALSNFDEFKKYFPKVPRGAKHLILLMDDLQDYLAQGLDISNEHIRFLRGHRCIIWFNQVSSWETDETNDFEYKQLESFTTFNIERLTDEEIKEVKTKETLKEKELFDSDGTIGSIFLPLEYMKGQYRSLPPKQRIILEIIKQAYMLGFVEQGFVMPYKIIYNYYNLEFQKSELTKIEFDNILTELVSLNFISKVKTHKNFIIEPVYIEKVVNLSLDYDDFIAKWEEKDLINAENWFKVGYYYSVSKRNFQKAINAYQKAVDIKPDYHEVWYNMGIDYIELGKYETAIEKYQKAVDIKPDKHEAWYNMGNAYIALEKYETAIEKYQKAVDIKPDDHQAWYNMGRGYIDLGKYETAIEKYQKAVDIKPDKHQAWLNMGVAYSHIGKYETAIEKYQKAVEIKPDKPQAWYSMGVAYGNLEKYEAAIISFEKAVEIKPDNYQAWFLLGVAYFATNKFKKAIKPLVKILDIEPLHNSAWYFLGEAYKKLGNELKAKECFDKHDEILKNLENKE